MPYSHPSQMMTEFVGTFFLCFTVALTAGSSKMAALAIGTVLSIVVYGGGPISGGHYNPAVSLACFLTGKTSARTLLEYTVCQVLGALVAGFLAKTVLGAGNFGYPAVGDDFDNMSAIISEAVCTCFLCTVVLGAACSKANTDKDFFGYAIGMTVFACAVSSGRVSGGAFNPAVGLLSLADEGMPHEDTVVYLAGPYLGAFFAAVILNLTSPDDNEGTIMKMSSAGYNKLVAEMMGTFFLTYTVAMTAGGKMLAGLAIGTSLICGIYGLGHVSGGHFNPAVTFGIFCKDKITGAQGQAPAEMLGYIGFQVLGALIAVFLANHISDNDVGAPAPGTDVSTGMAALMEVVATSLLVYTVLNTACTKSVEGNNYYGYAIGSVVFVMATAVGPISGGGFNPAVCTACLFINKAMGNLALYWVGPLLGGVVAAAVHNFTHIKTASAAPAAAAPAPAATDASGSML
jgi:aquaporin Z